MKELIAILFFCYSICIYGQNPKVVTQIPGAPSSAFFSWSCNGLQFYQDYVAATNNTQIWRTDGTAAGTFPLTNFAQGNGTVYSSTDKASVSGNTFYFSVLRSNVYELWKSDGTVNGTVQVNLSPAAQTMGFIIANSTHVFFSTGYSSFEDLYSVDNSGTVTFLQRLTQPYAYGFTALSACIFKNKLVTWKQSVYGTNNNQLFITDGTVAGSYSDPVIFGALGSKMIPCGNNFVLIKVPINSQTANLVKVPGIANGGIGTPEIFYTLGDGNNLKDYNYHYSSSNQINGMETFGGNATIGNSLLLSGYSDNQGWEIWKTDGTAGGTILVKDIYPGIGSGFDRWNGFVINGKYVFDAYTLINGNGRRCIFFSDGTTMGTDYFPQRPPSNDPNMSITDVIYFNNKAYFRSLDDAAVTSLWQTDGSLMNTLPVTPSDKSIDPALTPFGKVASGNILYKSNNNIMAFNPDYELWNGSVDNNWNNAANWENTTVPSITDKILVPGSAPNYPLLISNLTINSLWLNSINAIMTNNAVLTVNGELGVSISNTLNGSGSVNFSGTSGNIFDGNGTAIFPISLSGGDVTITGSNKTIPQLNFQNAAKLFLGNYDVAVTQVGGILGYASDRFIVTNGSGRLILPAIGTATSSTSAIFPIGKSGNSYTPALITNNGTSQQFNARATGGLYSSYNVTYPESPNGSAYTSSAVNTTWFITTQGSGQVLNASVELQWSASDELPGFNRNSINLAHYVSNTWNRGPSGTASGTNPYTFSRNGLATFSPFGIVNTSLVLPVSLLYFSANYNSNKVKLQWVTVSEQNSSHFIIERSNNGIDYTQLGRIEAAGTSNINLNYDFTDLSPLTGTSFYRLKMYDKDNNFKISRIVPVKNGLIKKIEIFPNPAHKELHVQLSSAWSGSIYLKVTDLTGQVIDIRVLQNNGGQINTTIDISKISPGIYFLTTINDSMKDVQKFVIR